MKELIHITDREEARRNLREYNKRNPIDLFMVESDVMLDALVFANKLSQFNSNVLILGDSGVGKEALAKYIHCQSDRRKGPFMAINCSAIPGNLFESEVFGYEKGGFTGADKTKAGLFEEAQDGTIFLDEIGELPEDQQPKLLRFLESKSLIRIGGNKVFNSNARIICATNANMCEKIEKKEFREDLYYRISTAEINIPPLRERKADIEPLLYLFLDKLNKQYALNKQFTREALDALKKRTYPGNVREVRNVVERMMINSTSDFMTASDIEWRKHWAGNSLSSDDNIKIRRLVPLEEAIKELERKLLQMGSDMGMSSRELAKVLEVNQSTIIRKLNMYKIKK
ncbi:sigma-54 interaction domain-containing protein [Sinanaerobacter chloroacetimidivorans]|jgi:transcriptional regulator with PAS, ATPase and Fis domain|uniref:Sigma-54-dependent Fis family transcriptional regulator n=1 Tax=Sinanaerobacter chloroacetimidivorans TaxID=2818044 RepID=A0A8J7W193_9FIRM|nr:sigma-54 dependent transcriptional regulator [Sinanaerobacter chloroacetimidivorans]MBR0597316.1 sigma-54-dependent Fis family transcriptional regulator [Sinanaerobacter chloroacetimidivorans]